MEHLSSLLERDLLPIEDYNALVDRILAATTDAEIGGVLATLPAPLPAQHSVVDDVLLVQNEGGVVKQAPGRLAPTSELRNDTGVMKIDFRFAEIDGDEVDLEIDNDRGVVKVRLPAGAAVQLVEQRGGGVVKNRTARVAPDRDAPRIRVHVNNGTGVVKIVQARSRRRWFGR